MTPRDDDHDVDESRDEATLAGRPTTGEDDELAGLVADLRAVSRQVAPAPSAELAALLQHGLPDGVVPLDGHRRRRRRVTTVAVGVALSLVGGVAAAAVHDGVPVDRLPGEVVDRIVGAVRDLVPGTQHHDPASSLPSGPTSSPRHSGEPTTTPSWTGPHPKPGPSQLPTVPGATMPTPPVQMPNVPVPNVPMPKAPSPKVPVPAMPTVPGMPGGLPSFGGDPGHGFG